MEALQIAPGVHWVAAPEAGLFVLCGCPADSVKLLMKKGLIRPTRRDGVSFETGPNAILLAEPSAQNEMVGNFAEFPVLQMLYRQGMLIPGHPGNTGAKPLLVGRESQVRSQSEYILRGNYGLTSAAEMTAAGASEAEAREYMRMKLWFAYGRIRQTGELLDTRIVGDAPVELRAGVTLRRTGVNLYEFSHAGQTVAVDLNLAAGERYPTSYALPFQRFRLEDFAVVHNGEGNGWDPERPCMGTIIVCRGRIYLVDAGPNIDRSLAALGISVNDVEGIFQSHCHDDHFAGFPTLARADHRVKYFATPLVRASAAKKLSALAGIDEADFPLYFDVHDLSAGEWNDIDGLAVRPAVSAHPVETTVFFFRSPGEGGFRTYSHLSDIATFEVLGRMAAAGPGEPGADPGFVTTLKSQLRAPADIKKIDGDGPPIHGEVEDFRGDASGRLYISHRRGELTAAQKEVGTRADFGQQDVLVQARENHVAGLASRAVASCFAGAQPRSLRMLAACPVVELEPGRTLLKQGQRPRFLYLVLRGVGESLDETGAFDRVVSAGALLGEFAAARGGPVEATIRSTSWMTVLRIPVRIYLSYLRGSGRDGAPRALLERRSLLRETWLLGEHIGCPVERVVAGAIQSVHVAAGEEVPPAPEPSLSIVVSGELALTRGGQECERLSRLAFFGEEEVLRVPRVFAARALTDATLYGVPARTLSEIPVVRGKLQQTLRRRALLAAPAPALAGT